MKPAPAARVSYSMNPATDSPGPQLPPDKPIPLSIALVILGLILLGGAGLIWHYVYRPPRTANVMRATIPTAANPRVAGGPTQPIGAADLNARSAAADADLPDGVHARDAEDLLFKAGDAYLRVLHDDGRVRYAFGFFTLAGGEWEHGYLTQAVRHIVNQDEFARELAVTDDQLARLKELPEAPPAKWPQADRDRFIAMHEAWARASGDERIKAGGQIVKDLRAYADQRRAADQKVMALRVERIKAILTAPQLAKVNPIPRWDLKPASSPSTPDRAPRDP